MKGIIHAGEGDDIAAAVAEAFDLATNGEAGPVVLHYAGRLFEGASDSAAEQVGRARHPPPALEAAAIDEALALLLASRRPLIMAGHGCAGAHARLRELAELIMAPVFTTVSGRGVLPEDHELALGFEFARGDVHGLNELIRESDCVLAVGWKLTSAGTDGFRLELPPDRLIHVDASADVLGATYPGRLVLAGTAEGFLEQIIPAVQRHRAPAATRWTRGEAERWKTRFRAAAVGAGPEPVFPGLEPGTASAFFAALQRALPRDGIVVTDSGFHQTLVRRHLDVHSPRGLIVPSDFQSMGFGLPAAIGAKVAAPDRAVVAVIGDGGFTMSGMELLTAVRERLAITLVVFNDGRLNRIRLQQLAQYGHSEGCEILNPDFEAFSRAVGVDHARGEGDIEGTLRTAIASARPTLVVSQGAPPLAELDSDTLRPHHRSFYYT